MSIYSKKKQMKPLTIEDTSGDIRVYKGFKLNAFTIMNEGMKIGEIFLPSIGSCADSFINKDEYGLPPATFAYAAQMLKENLSDEYLEVLLTKLSGNLICNGEVIEDFNDHFDDYIQDLPEVMYWVFKENFYSFFMENTLVRLKLRNWKENLDPHLQNLIETIFSEKESQKIEKESENGNSM